MKTAHILALLALVASGCDPSETPTKAYVEARDPLDVPRLDRTSKEVFVDLHAVELVGNLGEGYKTSAWTFDGKIPGPPVRAKLGDTITLRLTNNSSNKEPHSIDLHAVVGPGGGGTDTKVMSGESAELPFRAMYSGAVFYHCAAEWMPWEHVAHGMYGAILIEPENGLKNVDKEIYLAQSEWYLKHADEGDSELTEEEKEHSESETPDDVWVLDEAAAEEEKPTLFTFNGHSQALASSQIFGDRVHVAQGQRLRVIFANAGPNLASSFHIVGGIFDKVWTGSFDQPHYADKTVLIAPGSAAIFELNAPVPGVYSMVDHALFRAKRGAAGKIHVDQIDDWPSDDYSPKPTHEGGH